MSILKDVLNDEHERLLRLHSNYKKEYDHVKKGVVVNKKIKGKEYPYLQWRSSDKVNCKYIPKSSLEMVKKEIEKRKKIKAAIIRVNGEIRNIEKALSHVK